MRGLPDVLPPISSSGAAGDGGIIAKIAASRKERHEAAVEDMRQELAGISAVRMPIAHLCSNLLRNFFLAHSLIFFFAAPLGGGTSSIHGG